MKNLGKVPAIKAYVFRSNSNLEIALVLLNEQFPKTEQVKSSDKNYPLFIAADSASYFIEEAVKNLKKAQKHVDFIYENENLLE